MAQSSLENQVKDIFKQTIPGFRSEILNVAGIDIKSKSNPNNKGALDFYAYAKKLNAHFFVEAKGDNKDFKKANDEAVYYASNWRKDGGTGMLFAIGISMNVDGQVQYGVSKIEEDGTRSQLFKDGRIVNERMPQNIMMAYDDYKKDQAFICLDEVAQLVWTNYKIDAAIRAPVFLSILAVLKWLNGRDELNTLFSGFVNSKEQEDSDSAVLLVHIKRMLKSYNIPRDRLKEMMDDITSAVCNKQLWEQDKDNISIIHYICNQLRNRVLPYLSSGNADAATMIFNQARKWEQVVKDEENNVVLTPESVCILLNKLAHVESSENYMDMCAGTGALAVNAYDQMCTYAEKHFYDREECIERIKVISNSIRTIEYAKKVCTYQALGFIIKGINPSYIIHGDSLQSTTWEQLGNFAEDGFYSMTMNPPYSGVKDHGMDFVRVGLSKVKTGRKLAVIIQASAGTGEGIESCKAILKHNTLDAVIKMPLDLFAGMAGVITNVYLFTAGIPHNKRHKVKFIDYSNDGMRRVSRKSKQGKPEDDGTFNARLQEVIDIIEGNETDSNYYHNKWFESTISFNGDDWGYDIHYVVDNTCNDNDFITTINEYINWVITND